MAYRWLQGEGLAFHYRSLGGISPHLQQAVMASEDQKFPSHHGFDWAQLRAAAEDYQSGRRQRGASTITMQVARNLFLWQGFGWPRKPLEAYYTVLLELLWPKWRIMEMYLNVAEWGRGVFGAEAAAQRHFGRSAAALTRHQAALLASVLPNPRRWSPARPTDYLRRRQAAILRQMGRFQAISPTSRVLPPDRRLPA
jgi:monofunctional biosynthetic peptidoglycan transglycosylase